MPIFNRLLRAASSILLAGALAADAETPSYPDQWESYFGNRGGQVALILYNVGIGSVLGSLPEQNCLIFSFPLKQPGPEGLPTPDEGKVLFEMDDKFAALIASFEAHDLGRVSTAGRRGLYIAVGSKAQDLGKALVNAAAGYDYAAKFRVEAGVLGEVYSYVLSPTREEQRIIGDEKVLRQLAENGDIADKVRRVDHWAYFPQSESAQVFARWATENGYSDVVVVEVEGGQGEYQVRSSHQGTMIPDDLMNFTMLQHQKAQELGGTYDGWETVVMR